MAREIAIREEFLVGCDESTVETVIRALGKEFLLIPLDGYRIEVNDLDYEPVCRALHEFKHDIELNRKR